MDNDSNESNKNKKITLEQFTSSLPEGKQGPFLDMMDRMAKEYGLDVDALEIIDNPKRLAAALWADPKVAFDLFEYKVRAFFPLSGSYPLPGVCIKYCLRLLSNLERSKEYEMPIAEVLEDTRQDAAILRRFVSSFKGVFYNIDNNHNDPILDVLIENPAFCRALLTNSFQPGKINFHSEELYVRSDDFLDGFLTEALQRYPDAGEIMAAEQAARLELPFSYDAKNHIVSVEWPGRDALLEDIESALKQAKPLDGQPPEDLVNRAAKAASLLQPWLDRKFRMLVLDEKDDEEQAKMLLALGANAQQYSRSHGYIPNDAGWGAIGKMHGETHLLQMAVTNNLPKLTRILFEQRGDKKIDALFEREHYGHNLLHLAINWASPEIVDYLLSQAGERKAELLATESNHRWTSLELASLAFSQMVMDLSERPELIEKGMRLMEVMQRHGAVRHDGFAEEVVQRAREQRVTLPAAFHEIVRRMPSQVRDDKHRLL